MKKWIFVLSFLLAFSSALVFSCLAVNQDPDETPNLYWFDSDTLAVQYNPHIDFYTVWYSLNPSNADDPEVLYDILMKFDNEDFDLARNDYFLIDIPTGFWATYWVSCEVVNEPEERRYSEKLSYNPHNINLYFVTPYTYSIGADNTSYSVVAWDIPEELNVRAVTLQWSTTGRNDSTWNNVIVFQYSALNQFTIYGTVQTYRYYRIVVGLANGGICYSNTIAPRADDMTWWTDLNVHTDPPSTLPVVNPVADYPSEDVANLNNVLFAGVFNTSLAPFVFIGLTMLSGFATLSYFLFKMH